MFPIAPSASSFTVVCPLCGRDHRLIHVFEVQTTQRYAIARCDACDFTFSTPRPTPNQLRDFYSSTYFKRSSEATLGYVDYRGMAEANARRMWGTLNSYVRLDHVSPRRILDVGCATGGFLAEARSSGWDCTGLELSQDAANVARREFGLSVLEGDLTCAALRQGSFGLITMWHVLEHLIDPREAIGQARALLDPCGLLFIELPNWNSLGRVVRRRSWSQLKPPEHINYFTPGSLRRLLARHGFAVLRCTTHYPSLMDRARVRRVSRPLHMVGAALAMAACQLGCGGYVRLVARRS